MRCFYNELKLRFKENVMNTIEKRVVIIGGSYYGNLGATLMLKSAIRGIKEHAKSTVCFDVWVENHAKNVKYCDDENVNLIEFNPFKYVILALPLVLLFKLLRVKSSNSLVQSCINASLFYDVSGICFIKNRKPLFLIYDFLVNRPAFWLNIPVIKAAQASGPFDSPLNRFLAINTLKKCKKVYARGRVTYNNLLSLGLNNISLATDIGFYFDDQIIDLNETKEIDQLNKPIIGISVSSVVYEKSQSLNFDYLATIESIIKLINDELKGSAIIIPHAIKTSGNKLRNNDIKIIRLLKQRNNVKFIFFDQIMNLNGIRAIISHCDFLLVSRFHAMVNALSLKKPVLVLGWSHKYQEVLQSFDISNEHAIINKTTQKEIIEKFKYSFDKKALILKAIEKNLNTVSKLSGVNFEQIPLII